MTTTAEKTLAGLTGTPIEVAAAAADIKAALKAKRKDAMVVRDEAAVSLFVHGNKPEQEVWRAAGLSTRTGWLKMGERVKARYPAPKRRRAATRTERYFGAPPIVVNADRVLARAVKTVTDLDEQIAQVTDRQHRAMAEMVQTGHPNHQVAKAAKVSTSFVAQFIQDKGITRPESVPSPA